MKLNMHRRNLCIGITAALGALIAPVVSANEANWPTKPIKLVVGYAAGGATDVVARLVANKM